MEHFLMYKTRCIQHLGAFVAHATDSKIKSKQNLLFLFIPSTHTYSYMKGENMFREDACLFLLPLKALKPEAKV